MLDATLYTKEAVEKFGSVIKIIKTEPNYLGSSIERYKRVFLKTIKRKLWNKFRNDDDKYIENWYLMIQEIISDLNDKVNSSARQSPYLLFLEDSITK